MAEGFLPTYILALGDRAIGVRMLNGLDNLLSTHYPLPEEDAKEKYERYRQMAEAGAIGCIAS